ncbi:MAG: FKBP-type peptidyl-prolyl cis-trans isomerase, partial [Polyangiaceae bacterium]
MRRTSLLFPITFALAFSPLACGPQERLSTVPVNATSGSSSNLPRDADPICGAKWKWNGTHCVPTDAAAAESASSGTHPERKTSQRDPDAHFAESTPTANIIVVDSQVGTGAEAKSGDTVKIHYTGTLKDGGKEFDSSRSRGPFEFKLGTGMVIKGFDRGIMGMKVGGKRTLTIPPELAYGR